MANDSMSLVQRRTRGGGRIRAQDAESGRDLVLGLIPLSLILIATWYPLGLRASYPVQVVALYLILCVMIVRQAPAGVPARGLGSPNRITLLRATLVLPVAALVFHAEALDTTGYWWIIVVCALALVLDAVDGWVARRTDGSTPFGARFDMEVDAFLILILSLHVWLSERAGPWILLIGALRYVFGIGGWLLPALRASLPPSHRRRVICGVQGVVLLFALAPVTPRPVATALAGGALALLASSFAIDVRFLLTPPHRRPGGELYEGR